MIMFEILEAFFGLLITSMIMMSPFVLPMLYPYFMRMLYKIACYFTSDSRDRYDSNGDYIQSKYI